MSPKTIPAINNQNITNHKKFYYKNSKPEQIVIGVTYNDYLYTFSSLQNIAKVIHHYVHAGTMHRGPKIKRERVIAPRRRRRRRWLPPLTVLPFQVHSINYSAAIFSPVTMPSTALTCIQYQSRLKQKNQTADYCSHKTLLCDFNHLPNP